MLMMVKETRINVRTTPQIQRDLAIAAELRGLTVSSLVNSLVVKVIREEKERDPQAFRPVGASGVIAKGLKTARQSRVQKVGILKEKAK